MYKYLLLLILLLIGCTQGEKKPLDAELQRLAAEVKSEFVRSWDDYTKYAWGHDVLLPLTKGHQDWYKESLYISPIDAYSTMKVMGLDEQAKKVEDYLVNEISWDKDLFVKTFEVNIRIMGGLLAMYHYTGDPAILEKTEDFGRRMLKTFDSPTGIPYYWFNLRTGETKGEKVNIAEAATYMLELGILSYYTKNPVYYQAAKKANLAIWERVSKHDLVGEVIDVESGEWINTNSHICAGIDSYYEYMYKSLLLFGDKEIEPIWQKSLAAINTHLTESVDSVLWHKRVNMNTLEKTSTVVTLYDAFFPSILAMAGHMERAEKNQAAWNGLWNKYGLEPMIYDYDKGEPNYPVYDLNPEIIESAYYLYHITGKDMYLNMVKKYWADIMKYCKHDAAFASIKDVRTMEKKDYMPTFFFAETFKYFYLTFTRQEGKFNLDDYVFNTEAHPFKKDAFKPELVKSRLGIE